MIGAIRGIGGVKGDRDGGRLTREDVLLIRRGGEVLKRIADGEGQHVRLLGGRHGLDLYQAARDGLRRDGDDVAVDRGIGGAVVDEFQVIGAVGGVHRGEGDRDGGRLTREDVLHIGRDGKILERIADGKGQGVRGLGTGDGSDGDLGARDRLVRHGDDVAADRGIAVAVVHKLQPILGVHGILGVLQHRNGGGGAGEDLQGAGGRDADAREGIADGEGKLLGADRAYRGLDLDAGAAGRAGLDLQHVADDLDSAGALGGRKGDLIGGTDGQDGGGQHALLPCGEIDGATRREGDRRGGDVHRQGDDLREGRALLGHQLDLRAVGGGVKHGKGRALVTRAGDVIAPRDHVEHGALGGEVLLPCRLEDGAERYRVTAGKLGLIGCEHQGPILLGSRGGRGGGGASLRPRQNVAKGITGGKGDHRKDEDESEKRRSLERTLHGFLLFGVSIYDKRPSAGVTAD